MNMAGQLSGQQLTSSFSRKNLTNADSEGVWRLTQEDAGSLKINHLLQALSEQGFNTSAIASKEKLHWRATGTLVGEILTLRAAAD